ncbi:hypothetical protein DOTSEDRAFT_50862 [Dothistroma septosporum NZE10]|uniref:Uncharacterized protein n=1 Tax=Dothistroma septosporum (strain NZE10 / CBS 128990) TaxID=675120 RepID=N1PYZ7_DOTSN|nr:hypothetical protein DOTSEDRAFT_50862 [Dothistroma septosporum NZE10]
MVQEHDGADSHSSTRKRSFTRPDSPGLHSPAPTQKTNLQGIPKKVARKYHVPGQGKLKDVDDVEAEEMSESDDDALAEVAACEAEEAVKHIRATRHAPEIIPERFSKITAVTRPESRRYAKVAESKQSKAEWQEEFTQKQDITLTQYEQLQGANQGARNPKYKLNKPRPAHFQALPARQRAPSPAARLPEQQERAAQPSAEDLDDQNVAGGLFNCDADIEIYLAQTKQTLRSNAVSLPQPISGTASTRQDDQKAPDDAVAVG